MGKKEDKTDSRNCKHKKLKNSNLKINVSGEFLDAVVSDEYCYNLTI